MKLTPRYGSDPIVTLDGSPADIAGPTIAQRRRLAATLTTFDDDQWAHPSRCDGWSVRDVIVHLDSTNSFWTYSVGAGRRGKPTEFMATFDPVASPADLVAASDASPGEVLDRFLASTDSLVELLESLDGDEWSALAEAPPGHLSISAVMHHALWDSWVHERDILLPMGASPAEEADEVIACLRYGAALSPALALSRGHTGRGILSIAATDPEVSIVVEVGDSVAVSAGEAAAADVHLTGSAVELLEAISIRRPIDQEIPAASAWMVLGLAETFDVVPG